MLPQTFMSHVLNHIQSVYPSSWISGLVVNNENIGMEILHPNDLTTYLSIDIFPNQVLIAVLEESNRSIPFDLGGFHFDFSSNQLNEIKIFFNNHCQKGMVQ